MNYLVKALRRKAHALAKEQGASIAESFICPEAGNTAWLILRLSDADSPLLLLHGVSTISLSKLKEVAQEGVGIEINVVPWDIKLLPLMQAMAQNDANAFAFCPDCGHEKPPLPLPTEENVMCPGCERPAY